MVGSAYIKGLYDLGYKKTKWIASIADGPSILPASVRLAGSSGNTGDGRAGTSATVRGDTHR